jgi:hypothetical protein
LYKGEKNKEQNYFTVDDQGNALTDMGKKVYDLLQFLPTVDRNQEQNITK